MSSANEDKTDLSLTVEEVVRRDWFRTQIRARLDRSTADDKSHRHIQIVQSDISLIWLPHIGADISAIRIEADTDIFLVVRGRNWRVGDPVLPEKIIYRFEP